MKKTILTAVALCMSLSAMAATRDASISIDSRITYQHVTGFGGFSPSPTWSYWLDDNAMDKLFGKGDNQLGLNILRLYIANSRNAWNAGVANARRAKKHGAFVFASPWSPPAAWKSNNSDSNGGELLESRYADWATFLHDYYKYMKQQGVSIDAVSIQNEPDWKAEYQSCIWTGEKMAKFLREQGSKIECKIIAPEAIHFTRSMHEPMLNDPEACAQLDIVGGHFYGWDGSSYPLAAQKGKEVWMTEFLINERQQNEKKNITWKEDGFLFARSINDAMLANMSAWVHYSLKRYYGCLGDGQFGTVDNAITKRGYILSHYAKYVSGTTRVRHLLTDGSGRLSSSAYITPGGDSIVVMVLNPSADSYRTTLTLPFNTLKGKTIVTTETQNVVKEELAFEAETQQPQIDIQPYSVSTLIFARSSSAGNDEGDIQTALSVFDDQFDLAGASCVPAGWRTYSEGGLRTAGSYSLGPRIMSFSSEGAMQNAFYFRSGDTAAGYISYGEEDDYRLELEPGKYSLCYSTLGWKATPGLSAQVLTASGTRLATLASTPTSFVSASGSSSRVTSTADFELEFDITEKAPYVLKWLVVKSNGGLNEVLVGNIRLLRIDETTAIEEISAPASSSADAPVFDLYGRQAPVRSNGTVIIRQGKKIIVR